METTKQIVVTVTGTEYYDFFFSPNSCHSLNSYIQDGWTLKFIKDNNTIAVALFEKETYA